MSSRIELVIKKNEKRKIILLTILVNMHYLKLHKIITISHFIEVLVITLLKPVVEVG